MKSRHKIINMQNVTTIERLTCDRESCCLMQFMHNELCKKFVNNQVGQSIMQLLLMEK